VKYTRSSGLFYKAMNAKECWLVEGKLKTETGICREDSLSRNQYLVLGWSRFHDKQSTETVKYAIFLNPFM
jgi:hypothetical protein